jgi:hypothetical protein
VKPFGNETPDTHFSLFPFEELVRACASAVQWKVREISASTLAVLVDPSRASSTVKSIISSISDSVSSSFMHGSLLQIEAILECHSKDCLVNEPNFLNSIAFELLKLKEILNHQHFSVGRFVFLRIIKNNFLQITSLPDSKNSMELLKYGVMLSFHVLSGTSSAKLCPNYMYQVAASIVSHEYVFPRYIDKIEDTLKRADKMIVNQILLALANGYMLHTINLQFLVQINSVIEFCQFICEDINSDVEQFGASLLVLLRSKKKSHYQNVCNYLGKPKVPYSLISTLLEYYTLLCIDGIGNWKFFFDNCELYSEPDRPCEIRQCVVACLAQVKESISLDHCDLPIYGKLVNKLIQDDDPFIRSIGLDIISYYVSFDVSKCELISTSVFVNQVSTQKIISMEWIDNLLSTLTKTPVSILTVEEDLVLFDAEDLNTFQISVIDVFVAANALLKMTDCLRADQMISISRQLEARINHVIKIVENVEDLLWKTNQPHVFNLLFETISCYHILQKYHSKADSLDYISIDIFSKLGMHPWLQSVISQKGWETMSSFFLPSHE